MSGNWRQIKPLHCITLFSIWRHNLRHSHETPLSYTPPSKRGRSHVHILSGNAWVRITPTDWTIRQLLLDPRSITAPPEFLPCHTKTDYSSTPWNGTPLLQEIHWLLLKLLIVLRNCYILQLTDQELHSSSRTRLTMMKPSIWVMILNRNYAAP